MSGAIFATYLDLDSVVGGRYEVLSVLGEGGMAVIYEARHVYIERLLALKVLAFDPAKEPGVAKRFLDEARLAARLDHPNVVAIHDFGFIETPGGRRPYIAMEYLEGHDLAVELERHGPLEPQRAWSLMVRALDGLACAHRGGIVHKDLKPENIFLTRPGAEDESVHLLDFGVAGVRDSVSRHTKAGELSGTPQYLAPEYIESGAISPTIDVYQMGLILIEMLTGRPAVDGTTPYELLHRHCNGEVDIPSWLRSSSAMAFLDRALCLDLAHRFTDAAAMRDALAEQRDVFAELTPDDSVGRLSVAPRKTKLAAASAMAETTQLLANALPVERVPRRVVVIAFAVLVAAALLVLVAVGKRVGFEPPSHAATPLAPQRVEPPKPGEDLRQPAPERAIAVRFETEPPGGHILFRGQQMGTTPADVLFVPSEAPIEVELVHEGYEPARLRFVPSAGLSFSTVLEPTSPPLQPEAQSPGGQAEPAAPDRPQRRTRTKGGSGQGFPIIP